MTPEDWPTYGTFGCQDYSNLPAEYPQAKRWINPPTVTVKARPYVPEPFALLVSITTNDPVTPEDRRRLKDRLGDWLRTELAEDGAVSIDVLAVPLRELNEWTW